MDAQYENPTAALTPCAGPIRPVDHGRDRILPSTSVDFEGLRCGRSVVDRRRWYGPPQTIFEQSADGGGRGRLEGGEIGAHGPRGREKLPGEGAVELQIEAQAVAELQDIAGDDEVGPDASRSFDLAGADIVFGRPIGGQQGEQVLAGEHSAPRCGAVWATPSRGGAAHDVGEIARLSRRQMRRPLELEHEQEGRLVGFGREAVGRARNEENE